MGMKVKKIASAGLFASLSLYLGLVVASAGRLTYDLLQYPAVRENPAIILALEDAVKLVENENRTQEEIDSVFAEVEKVTLVLDSNRENRFVYISRFVNSHTLNDIIPALRTLPKLSFPDKLFYDGDIRILAKSSHFYVDHPDKKAYIDVVTNNLTVGMEINGFLYPGPFFSLGHEIGHLRHGKLTAQEKRRAKEFARLVPPADRTTGLAVSRRGNPKDSDFSAEERYAEAYADYMFSSKESPMLDYVHGDLGERTRKFSPSQVKVFYLDRKDAPKLYARCLLSPFIIVKNALGL